MAGDWIAMEHDLWECPQVVRILSAMCPQSVHNMSERCRIIGALYRTWTIVDRFAVDGILHGYTKEALDSAVGIDGWSENLQHVGWLVVEAQHLVIPGFAAHFSKSAKRRKQDQKRKRIARNECPQSVRTDADTKRTTEEKRTEEKSKKESKPKKASSKTLGRTQNSRTCVSPGFSAWWKAYPRKVGKAAAEKNYIKALAVIDQAQLLAITQAYAKAKRGADPKYIPHPATWLNQQRWEDDQAEWTVHTSTDGRDVHAEAEVLHQRDTRVNSTRRLLADSLRYKEEPDNSGLGEWKKEFGNGK